METRNRQCWPYCELSVGHPVGHPKKPSAKTHVCTGDWADRFSHAFKADNLKGHFKAIPH